MSIVYSVAESLTFLRTAHTIKVRSRHELSPFHPLPALRAHVEVWPLAAPPLPPCAPTAFRLPNAEPPLVPVGAVPAAAAGASAVGT